jgi:CubicO group peptidase (beta-lactamase class C family)
MKPTLSFPPRVHALRAAFLSVAFPAFATLGLQAAASDVAARLDEIVQRQVAAEQFTGAVLVAKRGAPIFDRGYGLANREWDIPNTPTTHFRIGSITKQFTAVAILRLEELGKLKLTDTVATHWSDAPASWSKITVQHLLSQTSGLPNVTRDPEFILWKFQPTTVRQMVGRFRDKPLEFAPGERHVYSNSNYLVLGLLIEEITKQRYGDFLLEQVLNPLGLNNTGVDSNLDLLPRRASGYWRRGDRILNAPYSDMTVPHASGAMYSTTHDLWRWAEALFGENPKLLTAASRAKLLTPAHDNYALGVRVAEFQGRKLIEHGGNISGFSSYLRYYPQQGLTVVVLANLSTGEGAEGLLNQLSAAALTAEGDAQPRAALTLPTATLERYCGVYDIGSGRQVTFRLTDGTLTAQATGQPAMPVIAESETKFYFKTVNTEVEFVRDEAGKVTHLLMKRDGRVRKAPRVSD